MIGFIFSYIAILLRVILRWVSFVGDAVLVMAYCLAMLPLVAPTRDPNVFARELMNMENLYFRIPLVALVLYLLVDFVIYKLFYQSITTYGRYMYAVRTFLLMLLPAAFMVTLIVTSIQGNFMPFAQTFDEWLGLLLGVGVLIITAWAFFGIAEFLIESVALFSTTGSKLAVHQTYMTPRQVLQILFQRQSEFEKQPNQSKRLLYRQFRPLSSRARQSKTFRRPSS